MILNSAGGASKSDPAAGRVAPLRFGGFDAERAAMYGYEVRTDENGLQYAVPSGTAAGSLVGATPRFDPAAGEVVWDAGAGAREIRLPTDLAETAARTRFTYERARAFGLPVLRSLHPDALLMGYSFHGFGRAPEGPEDRMTEANHVVRSSLQTSRPVAFTTRSWKFGWDVGRDFLSHAIDHIINGMRNSAAPSRAERDELLWLLQHADRREIEVRIDGVPHLGTAFDLFGSTFVRLPEMGGAAMISIAATVPFIEAGFASDIPE